MVKVIEKKSGEKKVRWSCHLALDLREWLFTKAYRSGKRANELLEEILRREMLKEGQARSSQLM